MDVSRAWISAGSAIGRSSGEVRVRGRRRQIVGGEESKKQRSHWMGGPGDKRPLLGRASEARINLRDASAPGMPTCDEYVDSYLVDYGRQNKSSSLHTQTCRLRRFREEFEGHSLDLSRAELKEWINGEGRWSSQGPIPPCELPAIISLYNHAIDESDLPLTRSPVRKLTPRSRGRADQPPPSAKEFQMLLDGCWALEGYGRRMRAMMLFAAYTLMRPSELYALQWTDIDFDAMRIRKMRRVYRGTLDQPKTGAKLIALTPPAREAVKSLSRRSNLVFPSKAGKMLSAPTFSGYWAEVLGAAGLKFDFYHATKHYGVHYMWTKLGLSPRAIAAQAGWKLDNANRMLAIYGHGEVGALEEVDQAFRGPEEFPGREVGARLDSWVPRGGHGSHPQHGLSLNSDS
jgi:Phage integrase family